MLLGDLFIRLKSKLYTIFKRGDHNKHTLILFLKVGMDTRQNNQNHDWTGNYAIYLFAFCIIV